jgi:hypothetical protein
MQGTDLEVGDTAGLETCATQKRHVGAKHKRGGKAGEQLPSASLRSLTHRLFLSSALRQSKSLKMKCALPRTLPSVFIGILAELS